MRGWFSVAVWAVLGLPALQVAGTVAAQPADVPAPATAAQEPSQAKGEEAFQVALGRLKSKLAQERASAADEMGRRGYRKRKEIGAVLTPVLQSDPEPLVRAAAGRALGRLGVREAIPALVAAL